MTDFKDLMRQAQEVRDGSSASRRSWGAAPSKGRRAAGWWGPS